MDDRLSAETAESDDFALQFQVLFLVCAIGITLQQLKPSGEAKRKTLQLALHVLSLGINECVIQGPLGRAIAYCSLFPTVSLFPCLHRLASSPNF